MAPRKDPATPVSIDPAVPAAHIDPQALRYQQALDARRASDPRGGPQVHIPRLDTAGTEQMGHLTMAQLRQMQDAAAQPLQAGAQAGGVFGPQGPVTPAPSKNPLLQTDTLPEAAKEDPLFQAGMGAMAAVNQPHLAFKYGVMRNGQLVPPQVLMGVANPGLKKETVEGLKALEDFNRTRAKVESGEKALEDASAASPAGSAGRLAGGESAAPVSDEEREKMKRLSEIDDFDFHTYREMMMKDILNNESQKRIVDETLVQLGRELDLTELIIKGFCTQVVPIVPGKFEPEFQSMSGEEDLALKRLIAAEAKELNVSERYLLDKYSMMSVACGLRSVNKVPLDSHLDKDGKFDDDLFFKKFSRVLRFPLHMIASLGVNYFWFDMRVRKLFVAEKIKNG